MNFVHHPTTTRVLGAPPNWDHSKLPCGALPITDTNDKGIPSVVSFWKPTPEELALLNAGYPVALAVTGVSMPPVSVWVPEMAHEVPGG